MTDSEIWGPIHEIGQIKKMMMDSEIWGPIHEIGQIKKNAQLHE
jgi:hypothetical protein